MRSWPAAVLATGAALAAAAPPPASASPPPVRPGAPVSAHAMVHTCCTPPVMVDRIFSEAREVGARFVRVDVELSAIFETPTRQPDHRHWRRLDDMMKLSRRHGVRVLGILLRPPEWMSLDDADEFGRMAGEVAAHSRDTITHWEILNEPDGAWAFQGMPEQYARMLRAAYDEIGAGVPEAEVAMGGVMTPQDPTWIERVFATPGADAARAFDIANVHLRGHAHRLPGVLAAWRARLAGHGFGGPLWVTEHGYPSDPAYQSDPAFRGGEGAQAAYLTQSVLTLARAGADEVFVTLRDNLDGLFASEGVESMEEEDSHDIRRKPAFAAVRRLVDRWDELMAARTEQVLRELATALADQRVSAAERNVRVQRARARAARRRLTRLELRHWGATRARVRARLGTRVRRARRTMRDRRSDVAWAKGYAARQRGHAALHGQRATELASFVAGG